MRSIFGVVFAGILLPTACGEPARAHAHDTRVVIAPDETASFVELGGVRVECDDSIPFETSIGPSGMRHFVSGSELELRDGELVLGESRYGAVRAGDEVRVGPDGVTVNGVRRTPRVGD